MKLASDLQADHQALSQMRRDLLTAAFDREAGGHNIGGIPDEYNDDYGPLPDQETLRREIAADEGSGDPLTDEYQEFLDRNDLPHDIDALEHFINERGGIHSGDWDYLMQKFSRVHKVTKGPGHHFQSEIPGVPEHYEADQPQEFWDAYSRHREDGYHPSAAYARAFAQHGVAAPQHHSARRTAFNTNFPDSLLYLG